MDELWFQLYERDMPKFRKAAEIFKKHFSTSYSDQALARFMLLEKINEILKNQK